MPLGSLFRRPSRRRPLQSVELVPVVGVARGLPFRQSDAEARAVREESRLFRLDDIEAALHRGGIKCRCRGSRRLLVEGQQSDQAVVLRIGHPARVSWSTIELAYRDDWPTVIAVLHALMTVLGPAIARTRLVDLLIDPQRSVAQLCSDYSAALDAELQRAESVLTEAGRFMERVAEELSDLDGSKKTKS